MNADDQFAVVGISRDEGFGLDRLLADVEPQIGLAFGGIRTVALEALVRKDRADVLVVSRLSGGKPRIGKENLPNKTTPASTLNGCGILRNVRL